VGAKEVMSYLEEGTRQDFEQAWAEFNHALKNDLESSSSKVIQESSDWLKGRCKEMTEMLKKERESTSQNFLQKVFSWLKSIFLWLTGSAGTIIDKYPKLLQMLTAFGLFKTVGGNAAEAGAEVAETVGALVPADPNLAGAAEKLGFFGNLADMLPLFHVIAMLASVYDIAGAATQLQRSRGPALSSNIRIVAGFIQTAMEEIRHSEK
jgi:hypothetical protein